MALRILFFFIAFTLGLSWPALVRAFGRKLRVEYPDTWETLGAPRDSFDVSTYMVAKWGAYVVARKYRVLADRRLTLLGDLILADTVGVIGSIVLIFLVPENSYLPLP